MDKARVSVLRQLFKTADPNAMINIFTSNSKVFNEKVDSIIWDDTSHTIFADIVFFRTFWVSI